MNYYSLLEVMPVKKLSPLVLVLSAALLLPVASAMAEVVADPSEVIEVTHPAEPVYKDGKKYTDGAKVTPDAKDIIVLSPAAEVGGRGVVVIGNGYSSKDFDASALSSDKATIQKISGKNLVLLGNYNRFNIHRSDGRQQNMTDSVVLGSLNLLSRNIFDGSQEAAAQNQLVVGNYNKLYGQYAASFGFNNTVRNSTFELPSGGVNFSSDFAMAFGKNNTVLHSGYVMGYDNAIGALDSLPETPDSNARYYTVLALGANNQIGTKDTTVSNVTIGYSNIVDSSSTMVVGAQNDIRSMNTYVFGQANKVKNKEATDALMIGWNNRAEGHLAQALGAQNTAGERAVAAGYLNKAQGFKSAALGVSNVAGGSFSSAMGYDNSVSDARSSAFGYLNRNAGYASHVWGSKNTVTEQSSNAISAGQSNLSNGWQPITYGYGVQNQGISNLVVGYGAVVSGLENEVLGHYAVTDGTSRGLALGNSVVVRVDDGAALGSFAAAERPAGLRGYDQASKAAAADDLLPDGAAVATLKKAYEEAGAAYSTAAEALQAKTMEFDRLSSAEKARRAEELQQAKTAALEAEKAWHGARKSLADALGAWEATMPALALGNGEMGVTRQITGVAAGSADTDAVNVAQLKRLSAQMQEHTSSAWTPVAVDAEGARHAGAAVSDGELIFKGDRLDVTVTDGGKALQFGLTAADKARLSKVDQHEDLLTRLSGGGLPGGKDGKDGKDGVSVSTVEVDDEGRLQVTFDDGRVVDAGQVRGADGVGIADVKVTDEGHLSVVLENNRVIDAGALPGGGFDAAPLHARMDRMESKIDATAARTAALGALMPIDFDEQRPTQFGFGLGWQGGTPAFALGLMHYSDRDTLWNAGAAFADGRATLRAGATFRLGEKEEGSERSVETEGLTSTRQLQEALQRIDSLEAQIEELKKRP